MTRRRGLAPLWMPPSPDRAPERRPVDTWRAAVVWYRTWDPERGRPAWACTLSHVTLRPGETHETVLDTIAPRFAPITRADLALVEV